MTSTRPSQDHAEKLLRQACAELDRALRAGEAQPVERLLAEYPVLEQQPELAVELIYTEFVTRESLGQQPTAEAYHERFPSHRVALDRLFQVDALLRPDAAGASTGLGTQWEETWQRGAPPAPELVAPRKLGAYDLLEKIGSGGMGVVYLARQRGLNRLVAIKLLRTGPFADETEKLRFQREAETIAALQHPNIVQVHEVGEHLGEPFLVLEYCAGGNLRSALQQQPLPPEAAAALVETLARAVHFAHTRGVVHRDLKPANVLLSTPPKDAESGEGTEARAKPFGGLLPSSSAKITDFGLATRLETTGPRSSTGRIVGTASYMAPEQAAGLPGWVTPLVDVYALGTILYECLTGRPPFLADSDLETLRQVLAEEPVSLRRLQPMLPADLEVICLKCLAKEPNKRYPSAEALADDIRRFRSGEPIVARPSSFSERSIKWVRRNRTAAALIGVSVLALLIILGLNVAYLLWLRSAYDQAQEATLRAEQNAARAKEALAAEAKRRQQARTALDTMTAGMLDSFLAQQSLFTPQQKAYLQGMLRQYESFAADTPKDEQTQVGMADAFIRVARMYSAIDQPIQAEAAITRAVSAYEELLPANPDEYRNALAVCCQNRAVIRLKNRMNEEAEVDFARALHLFEELRKQKPNDAWTNLNLARCATTFGVLLYQQGKLPEAEERHRRAVELLTEQRASNPKDASLAEALADALTNLNMVHCEMKHLPGAYVEACEAIVKLRQEVLALRPTELGAKGRLALAFHNLGVQLSEAEQEDAAMASYRQALEIFDRLRRQQPGVPQHRFEWSRTATHIAKRWIARKDYAKADALLKEADAESNRLLETFPTHSEYQLHHAACLLTQGNSARHQGQLQAARACYQRSGELLEKVLRTFPNHPLAKNYRQSLKNAEARLNQSAGS